MSSVSLIGASAANTCTFVADLTAESQQPQDNDLQAIATDRAKAMTLEKGGNAMFVQSMSISQSAEKSSRMKLSVKAYSCAVAAFNDK